MFICNYPYVRENQSGNGVKYSRKARHVMSTNEENSYNKEISINQDMEEAGKK